MASEEPLLLVAVRILAVAAAEAVDQPVAAEEDQAAGEQPPATHPWPDDFSAASSTRSNATALISTPAPKAMISPIARRLMRKTERDERADHQRGAARVPQAKARPSAASPSPLLVTGSGRRTSTSLQRARSRPVSTSCRRTTASGL